MLCEQVDSNASQGGKELSPVALQLLAGPKEKAFGEIKEQLREDFGLPKDLKFYLLSNKTQEMQSYRLLMEPPEKPEKVIIESAFLYIDWKPLPPFLNARTIHELQPVGSGFFPVRLIYERGKVNRVQIGSSSKTQEDSNVELTAEEFKQLSKDELTEIFSKALNQSPVSFSFLKYTGNIGCKSSKSSECLK